LAGEIFKRYWDFPNYVRFLLTKTPEWNNHADNFHNSGTTDWQFYESSLYIASQYAASIHKIKPKIKQQFVSNNT